MCVCSQAAFRRQRRRRTVSVKLTLHSRGLLFPLSMALLLARNSFHFKLLCSACDGISIRISIAFLRLTLSSFFCEYLSADGWLPEDMERCRLLANRTCQGLSSHREIGIFNEQIKVKSRADRKFSR